MASAIGTSNRSITGGSHLKRARTLRLAIAVGLIALVASSDSLPLRAAGQVPTAEFVGEIRPGSASSAPEDFEVFQNALYFSANDGTNGAELWRLDSNGALTLVADINPGAGSSSPTQLTVVGAVLYFVAGRPAEGRELWQYDGVNPPSLVADIWLGSLTSFPEELTAFGNDLVFTADDGSGEEVFVVGPSKPIPVRSDIYPDDPSCDPVNAGCGSTPYSLTVYNGKVYFGAAEPNFGGEVYEYDGTGFRRLTDISSGPSSSAPGVQFIGISNGNCNNCLVFAAYSGFVNDLYSLNLGTGVPTMIATGNSFGGAFPERLTSFNSRVFFTAKDDTVGRELWVTDGTQAGTYLVQDLYQGTTTSDPRDFVVFNNELYFDAVDPIVGREVHATDGTTVRVVGDLTPGLRWNTPTPLGAYIIFGDSGPTEQPNYTTGTGSAVVTKANGTVINPTGPALDDPGFTLFNGALYFQATDGVGGDELWRITVGAAAPTTTDVVSSLNPSTFGQQVTFTATVTGTSPTGTVTFFDNGTSIGTVPLVSGVGSLDLSTLGAGSHSITAVYNGDADNASSTSPPLAQVVDPVPTTTDLITSLNPSDLGQSVTFTATVTGNSPTGSVSFFDGGATLGVVPLTGTTAILVTANLSGGSHDITARYGGDVDDSPSTSNIVAQVVNRAPSTTTLSSAPNPSLVGEMVEFTAIVSGGSGAITFMDGATTLAVVPFNGNTASLQTSSLSSGSHTITAIFSGDTNYLGSTSNAVVQVVNQGGTLIVIKQVINDHGGTATPSDFLMSVAGGSPSPAAFPGSLAGTSVTINAGSYTVTEVNLPTYIATASADCVGTIANGQTKTCTFINDDRPTTLELRKFVVNDNGGTALPTAWTLTANGQPFVTGVPTAVAAGQFTLAETGGPSGYTASSWSCAGGTLNGNVVTVSPNIAVQCSITNDDAPPNTPPVAQNQSVSTPEDTPLAITLTATDAQNNPLTYAVVTGPSNGVLSGVLPNLIYTPNLNYFGADSFTFKANDGLADSNVATIAITVTPVNDAPVAVADGYATAEDTPLIVPGPGVLGNDSDIDSSTITAVLVSSPFNGILSLNANGSFTYTPAANFNGADSFTYKANDGALDSNIVTVAIVVTPVNDPPVATADSYSASRYATLTVASPGVLGNDTDIEGAALTAVLISGPGNGTLTLNANGSFNYTPTSAFIGPDTFTYSANDGAATSAPVTVTIVVSKDAIWVLTGNLGSRRRFHTATLLTNGKVLVAGGYATATA